MPRKIFVAKLGLAVTAMALLPSAAFAGCGTDAACLSWVESQTATQSPEIRQLSLPSNVSVSDVSSRRIAGLGAGEKLCPTTCPVEVKNTNGGQVKACYSVCTPLSSGAATTGYGASSGYGSSTVTQQTAYASRETISPVVKQSVVYEPYEVQPVVQHHYVRVIRPVIYVHYPVPVIAPPVCDYNCKRSRYGY